MTTTWLIPLALFWPLAALYLGGGEIRIEGGGGLRQTAGLLLHFAAFSGIWLALRAGLGALGDGALLTLVLPAVVVSALVPLLARLTFRLVGVQLVPDRPPPPVPAA